MHKYIDVTTVKDFSKPLSFDEVYNDVESMIYNIEIDEVDGIYTYEIADALHEDYLNKAANYKSYIEPGMNARMLMELRKSAILPENILNMVHIKNMWKEHCTCETYEDVKRLRIKYFKALNEDYIDADWQYVYLCRLCLGDYYSKFVFDFECHYQDSRYMFEKDIDFIVKEATKAHLKGWSGYESVYGKDEDCEIPDGGIR